MTVSRTIYPGDRVSWRVGYQRRQFGVVVSKQGKGYAVRPDGLKREIVFLAGQLTKEEG